MNGHRIDQSRLVRQLQQALAVARAIVIAAEYPDDGLDLADAVSGLVIVLERVTDGLNRLEVRP